MADEEKKELKGEEDNSDEKNPPLSREGWIMLLSGEINKVEMKLFMYWTACIVISIAFLSGAVAAGIAGFHVEFPIYHVVMLILFLVLAVIVWRIYKNYSYPRQESLKPLINTREAIISGKLTDFSEIHRKWKEYMKKYYGKLLEKSEMDEEKKELKEKKGDSKEKDLEKNFEEQKEVLHALQRDISYIKRRMDGIDCSNLCYVFGSLFFGGGLTMMAVTIAPTVFGPVLFLVGLLIISIGALYKWRGLR